MVEYYIEWIRKNQQGISEYAEEPHRLFRRDHNDEMLPVPGTITWHGSAADVGKVFLIGDTEVLTASPSPRHDRIIIYQSIAPTEKYETPECQYLKITLGKALASFTRADLKKLWGR